MQGISHYLSYVTYDRANTQNLQSRTSYNFILTGFVLSKHAPIRWKPDSDKINIAIVRDKSRNITFVQIYTSEISENSTQ